MPGRGGFESPVPEQAGLAPPVQGRACRLLRAAGSWAPGLAQLRGGAELWPQRGGPREVGVTGERCGGPAAGVWGPAVRPPHRGWGAASLTLEGWELSPPPPPGPGGGPSGWRQPRLPLLVPVPDSGGWGVLAAGGKGRASLRGEAGAPGPRQRMVSSTLRGDRAWTGAEMTFSLVRRVC